MSLNSILDVTNIKLLPFTQPSKTWVWRVDDRRLSEYSPKRSSLWTNHNQNSSTV